MPLGRAPRRRESSVEEDFTQTIVQMGVHPLSIHHQHDHTADLACVIRIISLKRLQNTLLQRLVLAAELIGRMFLVRAHAGSNFASSQFHMVAVPSER